MNNLNFHSEDNGNCRVYYSLKAEGEAKRLLCYQLSTKDQFKLFECTLNGEPCHSFDYKDYLTQTPLPDGNTPTEIRLRKWLVKQVIADIDSKVNDYMARHEGMPTEEDMTINYLSRDIISRINEVYGQCFLVRINLYGEERGDRNAISTQYQKGEGYNAFNFCAAYATPMVNDSVIDAILNRDTSEYTSAKDDWEKVNQLDLDLVNLGACPLFWA